MSLRKPVPAACCAALALAVIACSEPPHRAGVSAYHPFVIVDTNGDGIDDIIGKAALEELSLVDGTSFAARKLDGDAGGHFIVAGDRVISDGYTAPRTLRIIGIATGTIERQVALADKVGALRRADDGAVLASLVDGTVWRLDVATGGLEQVPNPAAPPSAPALPAYCAESKATCEPSETPGEARITQGGQGVIVRVKQQGTHELVVACVDAQGKESAAVVIDPEGFGGVAIDVTDGLALVAFQGLVRALDLSTCREVWQHGDFVETERPFRAKSLMAARGRAYVTVLPLVRGIPSSARLVVVDARTGALLGWP